MNEGEELCTGLGRRAINSAVAGPALCAGPGPVLHQEYLSWLSGNRHEIAPRQIDQRIKEVVG